MAKCIFTGLTIEQAETLAHWFEGQGEQDASEWFDIHDVPTPYVNVHDKPCIQQIGDDVIVKCHTPK